MQAHFKKFFTIVLKEKKGVFIRRAEMSHLSVKFGIMIPTETNVPLDCFVTRILFSKNCRQLDKVHVTTDMT